MSDCENCQKIQQLKEIALEEHLNYISAQTKVEAAKTICHAWLIGCISSDTFIDKINEVFGETTKP